MKKTFGGVVRLGVVLFLGIPIEMPSHEEAFKITDWHVCSSHL